MRLRALVTGASIALLAACGGAPPPPAATGESEALPGLDPGEHLLLTPTGEGDKLLGRSVTRGPDGGWVLADDRHPGCEVTVRETLSSWTREHAAAAGDLAVFNAGVPLLADLRAKYGSTLRMRTVVNNTKVLSADVRGSCGDTVVTSVKIGTGKRELERSSEKSGSADVGVSGVNAGGGAEHWEKTGGSLSWNTEQAWSFTVGQVTASDHVDLGVEMPTRLADASNYQVLITTARTVWLVVLYQEADGRAGVLLPNMDNPLVVVTPGARLPLPTLQVSLRDPKVAAREKLIVFAFTEEEDFKRFRPPAGDIVEAEATQYLQDLPKRLQEIPTKRWSRNEVGYAIDPK